MQERRARSSLSNRHISHKPAQQAHHHEEAALSPDHVFQPEEGTLSSNLLAFNASNQQRLILNQESAASSKNQRLIVE